MAQSLLVKCRSLLPQIHFVEAETFFWSPQKKTIYMNSAALDETEAQWALVHETAHAYCGHQTYANDFGLLAMEVEAWHAAQDLSLQLGIEIDETHIQDCLNTYRDWLYARSTCPVCTLNSLQVDHTTYLCANCSTRWSVSASRFCRPYRMHTKHKKTPSETSRTVSQ